MQYSQQPVLLHSRYGETGNTASQDFTTSQATTALKLRSRYGFDSYSAGTATQMLRLRSLSGYEGHIQYTQPARIAVPATLHSRYGYTSRQVTYSNAASPATLQVNSYPASHQVNLHSRYNA